MDWKNKFTKTPYLVLFIILGAVGVTTAYGLITITLAGDVIIEGDTQMERNLNVEGVITGQTLKDLESELNALKDAALFKDLVVGNNQDADVSILLGIGGGTFFVKPDVPAGNNLDAFVGDFNNDFKLDVVTTNLDDDDVSILLGNGDGTFTAKPDVPVGNNPIPVAIGDLDNDNIPDVVVGNFDDATLSVLLGNGDGTFTAKPDVLVGNNPRSVNIGHVG